MSIQSLRDSSDGVVAKLIVGLIIVVFALFGMGSITTFLAPVPKVATVDGLDVTQQEMEVEVQRSRRILAAQGNELEEDQLRQQVLDTLVARKLLTRAAEELGLEYSSADLDAEIVSTPVFQIEGVYSPDQFQLVIGSAGYTALNYRNEMQLDKVFGQLNSGIRNTAFITDAEVQRLNSLAQQTRDIAYLRVNVEELRESLTVSEDEISAYYENNASQFMTQESVDIEYLEVKRDDLLDDVEVNEEDLLAFFQDTKEIYAEAESRRVSHILVEINDDTSEEQAKIKIDEVYDKITSTQATFTDLAKEYSDDTGSAELGGDLGFNPKGTFVDEFEEAAYGLGLNQVSGPVLTEFGYHLIKLVDMEDAKEPVFEDVKSRVEAEFREAEAEEMFVSLSSRLSEISYESPDLIDPSEELELSILTESDVNRFTDVGLGSNPAVQSVVFSDDVLLDRNNSELLEITPNHHVVVRITRYQPEEVMPIADVRTQIEETLSLEQAIAIAEDQAKDMVAMLESGSIARFVADKYNLKWTVSSETSRNQLTFDREISTQAFTLARPAEGNKSVGYAVLSNGDAVVMSVTNVNNKTEKESESDLDRLAKVLGAQQGLSEYQEFRSSLNPGGLVETL